MSKPFDQVAIDEVRVGIITQRIVTSVVQDVRKPKVCHVWFPKPTVTAYALREGNPPGDTDRPRHLRGMRLEIDVGEIKPSTARAVRHLLDQRRRIEHDPKKPLADYAKAREMVEVMRQEHRLVRLPWEN